MSKTITTPWDSADYLLTPEDRALYLEIMIEETEGDPVWIMRALNTIARSEGMTSVARKSGLSRENLYRSLSGDKKPEFATILKVMDALGLQLRIVAKTDTIAAANKASKPSRPKRVANGNPTSTSSRAPRKAPAVKKPRLKHAA